MKITFVKNQVFWKKEHVQDKWCFKMGLNILIQLGQILLNWYLLVLERATCRNLYISKKFRVQNSPLTAANENATFFVIAGNWPQRLHGNAWTLSTSWNLFLYFNFFSKPFATSGQTASLKKLIRHALCLLTGEKFYIKQQQVLVHEAEKSNKKYRVMIVSARG